MLAKSTNSTMASSDIKTITVMLTTAPVKVRCRNSLSVLGYTSSEEKRILRGRAAPAVLCAGQKARDVAAAGCRSRGSGACSRVPHTRPQACNTMADARACAASPDCISRAESQLHSGDVVGARSTLGYASSTRPKSSRWLNAAGLLALLEGDLFASTSLLRAALQLPFGMATHLPAQKNLYWVTHLLRDATENNEPVERAGREVLQTFSMAQAYLEDASAEFTFEEDALTVYDLPTQRAVCMHPMYDMHY